MMNNRAKREIELTIIPHACFSVKLPEITFGAIDDALEQAYRELDADPLYLFCSEMDYEKIDAEIDRCTNYRVYPGWVRTPATRRVNQTTGRLMHIVQLPELEDGTLLFGLMRAEVKHE